MFLLFGMLGLQDIQVMMVSKANVVVDNDNDNDDDEVELEKSNILLMGPSVFRTYSSVLSCFGFVRC